MDNWFVKFIEKYYRGRRYYRGIIFEYKLLSLEFNGDGGSAFICDGYDVEEVKIKFKQFTHHEKNILNEIISKEDIQHELAKGIIPEELFSLDFNIFPSDIDDISIDCSCYKTLMLCEDAVYLLYKISELFKDNPFLIFSLRGFDLEKTDKFPITDIEDIFTLNFRENSTCISSNSLFDDYYLLDSYLSEICISLNNKLSEIVNRFDKYNISLDDIDLTTIDVDSNYMINNSKISNEMELAFYLMKLEDNNSFLKEIVYFTKNLISDNKIIPQVFKADDKYYTRWIPALFYKDIANSCKMFACDCPRNLVTFNGSEISKENQIIIFISLFVNGLFEFMDYDEIEDLMEEECYELFFKSSNNFYLANQLSKKLSVFYMGQLPYDYLIEINDENDIFKLDFKIRNENIIKSIDEASLDELRYANNIRRLFLKFNINWKLNESIYLNKKSFIKFINKIKPLLDYLYVELSMPFKLYNGKFKLKLNVNVNSDDFFTISDLKDFRWEIEIGDNSISIEEFNKIPNNIDGIVKLNGNYFIVDHVSVNSLQNDIIFLPKEFKSYELLQIALLERYRNLKFTINDEFKKLLNFSTKVSVPKTLKATLRHYQEIGFSWLIHNIKSGFGSILADDMGLGKTIQVLATILYLKENNHLKNKQILIVAPTTLLSNWENEINKFAPDLNYSIYHGAMRQLNDSEVILTSYGMVRKDIEEFSKRQWFLCVLDEAQNIKNPSTKQTKAIKSINALNRIALTGTPIENRLLDYWSIFDFTNPEYLSNRTTFKKEYANPISKNNSRVLDNFKKITNPFILRRLKTDSDVIKDLPDKIVNDIYCTLSKKQTKLYDELLSNGLNDLKNDGNGIKRKGNILKLITSLKQICNHPAQYFKTKNPKIGDSLKLELLVEMVENILDVDEKVIIFTQYVQMGEIIKEILLKKFNNEVLFLHGSLKRDVREKIVNNFQNNSSFPILIATLKTGGVGLNLTAAQNVIHYDLWWNPAVENQATDRAYRIGQENDVMVYRFITKGTLEERIDDMIKDKLELAGKTIENQQTFITELSDEELKEILTLRL